MSKVRELRCVDAGEPDIDRVLRQPGSVTSAGLPSREWRCGYASEPAPAEEPAARGVEESEAVAVRDADNDAENAVAARKGRNIFVEVSGRDVRGGGDAAEARAIEACGG